MADKKLPRGVKAPGTTVAKNAAPSKPAKGKSNALATVSPLLAAMQEDAGAGLEMMTQGDLALPFIQLLQALSPQVTRGHEKFIAGAEAGDFFNTVTKEVYKGEQGVLVIPCHYEKVYNEWKPRTVGGGFINSSKSREEAELAKRTDPVGHVEVGSGRNKQQEPVFTDIVDTANHYVLVQQDDGAWTEAVVSMTSSKLKASRAWNSTMKMTKLEGPNGKFTPPSFARTYLMTSISAQNDQGIFYVPQVDGDEFVDDAELYEQARNFRGMFVEGGKSLSYANLDADADGTSPPDDDDDADDGKEKF